VDEVIQHSQRLESMGVLAGGSSGIGAAAMLDGRPVSA